MIKRLLLLSFITSYSFAFSVTPLVDKIESPRDIKKIYTIKNDSDKLVAVELDVREVVGEKPNRDELEKETDEFMVYPPQILVQPNSKEYIRVRYLGTIPVKQRVFRVHSYQIELSKIMGNPPSEDDSEEIRSGVTIQFGFAGHIFVGKKGTKPNLSIENIRAITDDTIEFEVRNDGLKSGILQNSRGIRGIELTYLDGTTQFFPKSVFSSSRVLPKDFVIDKIKFKQKLKGKSILKVELR